MQKLPTSFNNTALMFLRPRCAAALTPLSWLSRFHSATMPLKAKILYPGFPSQAKEMSTKPFDINDVEEQPGDDPNDVLFGSHYGVRTIELNRPNKMNSLDSSMARKIILRLKEWEKSELANIIIIGGAHGTGQYSKFRKAFCAGGDVAALVRQNASGPDGQAYSKDYFGLEYGLDHLIATYRKPYIAYMDGITMGGGVGLSVHAPFRIATENTIFSMPETSIGFFPDVGGSFFLPRLDGYIGTYLALTSNNLNGVNAFYTGIATHYIDSSSLPNLTARLAELEFKDYHTLSDTLVHIDATIEEFGTGIPHNERMLIAGEIRQAIDRCFRHDRVEYILDALDKERTSAVGKWASETKKTLLERSPTSLKVTLKQMRLGGKWNIREAFQREYIMASRFIALPDFTTGVSARLIDKPPTKPAWTPPTIHEVQDSTVDQFFHVEGETKLNLEGPASSAYKVYPAEMGLPTEHDIRRVVEQGKKETGKAAYPLRGLVVNKILRDKRGKLGVKEKVEEVLDRKCGVDDNGHLVWKDES